VHDARIYPMLDPGARLVAASSERVDFSQFLLGREVGKTLRCALDFRTIT